MINSDSDIEQAHDDDTESFYFGFHWNQNIKLLGLKKNFISINKKTSLDGVIVLLF